MRDKKKLIIIKWETDYKQTEWRNCEGEKRKMKEKWSSVDRDRKKVERR